MIRQKLPTRKIERESLRSKGQFWTPDWVAISMVKYALNNNRNLFDPSVGSGAFFEAAMQIDDKITFRGMDIDPNIPPKHLKHRVVIGDFLLSKSILKDGIVCNPPYKRHHRMDVHYKELVNDIGSKTIGAKIDARAGMQVYFLIKSLSMLKKNAKLAFIVSSDICEGKFSNVLWSWISANYRIDSVIIFDKNATPFEADVNPMIFLIQNAPPNGTYQRITCFKAGTNELETCISKQTFKHSDLRTETLDLKKSIKLGLSRRFGASHGKKLVNYATVCRGIATGSNDFFHMNYETAKKYKITQFTIPAINRTKNITTNIFSKLNYQKLKTLNQSVLLLNVNGNERNMNLKKYIKYGEKQKLDQRPLNKSRAKWFVMEKRLPPDIFFTYLGRSNNRFILNNTDATVLNTFHCIYVKPNYNKNKLFKALNDPRTIRNLPLVAKSYGFGALKVEPKSLENLVIPMNVLHENSLC